MAKNRTVNIPGCTLATIERSLIHEGERFRADYGDLSELTASIKMHGLINPITVTPQKDGDGYLLVAGGRRLAALDALEETTIPVRIFPEPLSELDLRLLELAENLQRKEMTWQEANSLQREIHRLQLERHGKPVPGQEGTGWTLEDTAQMLGVSRSQAAESIKLVDRLERYKEVLGDASRFKTENEARKAIKVVEESMVRAELAKRAAQRANSNSALELLSSFYNIGDCIEAMKALPDESFNFAEVDPPYAINLGDIKRDNECEGYSEIADNDFILFNKAVLEQVFRLLKPDSFCVYWFGPDPWFDILFHLTQQVGLTGRRIPLIWVKPNGQSLNPNSTLASSYETAFVLKKGTPILAKPGRLNSFHFTPVPPQKKHHPTQKPLELYRELHETFSFEGAKILVPFAGSGASLLGAHLCGRSAIGWDLNEQFKGGYLQMVQETLLATQGGE